MVWKKKDSCTTIKEVVERNSGMLVDKLLSSKEKPLLYNLDKAVTGIKSAIENKQQITVVADYDCDGITSAAIMYLLFKELGVNVKIRLPKRFSEGYGLSEKIIDEISSGLLITVDNGISAFNEIQIAKDKGLDVIVMDHHLTDGELPPADIIIDPHIVGENEFEHYCGAGLAYRLACEMIDNEDLLKTITGIAAIGTVADIVPLIDDNRNIVINGIKYINQGYITNGLRALLRQLKSQEVDETFLGFTLAPILNAQGRLYDNGASISYRLLASESENNKKLDDIALEMITVNNTRKTIVNENYDLLQDNIDLAVKNKDSAIIVNMNNINEGVVGILAGKIAEETHRPCFVFTNSDDVNILKGSGRSYGNINIKSILDKIDKSYFAKYGGHPGAAGVSLYKDKFDNFKSAFVSLCNQVSDFDFDTIYYDLEINQDEIDDIYCEVKKYAPYGEGNKPIVFCVKDFLPTEKFGAKYKAIGENHIKLFGKNNDAIGFGLYNKFKDKDEKGKWDLLGDINENTYNGKTSIQFIFRDIQ